MNEIEYKLDSKNPVLITHGISKLLETVKKKIPEEKDPLKIPELDLLFSKCKSENSLVSSVACQALVCLVDAGLLGTTSILSKLIATIGEAKNYLSITSAICELLKLDLKLRESGDAYQCPFSIEAPQHPLITVLTQRNDVWRDILGHMQSMIHQSKREFLALHVELLRPVFVYIICNPTTHLPDSCKQQAWHLLMRTDGSIHLQLEILQWLRVTDTRSCIDTSSRVLELAEYAAAERNEELCSGLMPLVAALALDLLKHGADPRPNFLVLETLMRHVDRGIGSVMMYLLAEMVEVTSSIYLMELVRLGSMILEQLNPTEASALSLTASLLPWMAYASLLSSDALDVAKDLITAIMNKSTWPLAPNKLESNKYYPILHHVNPTYQFYSSLSICLDSLSQDTQNLLPWLERLSASKDILPKYRLILCGLFLKTSQFPLLSKIAKILAATAKATPKFSSNVLSLILHKLSTILEISETKELLFTLPELAVSKENMPTIIHTLDTLFNSDPPLKYVAVELYLRVWKIEPRCYRHLLPALIDLSKNDHTFVGTLTAANTMKIICETRPEQGAELVPLLSQILNKGTAHTGAASALALRGISALCVADIADVCSVWRALSPRMEEERRTTVIKSICEFFQDIPSTTPYNEDDFNQLLTDAFTKLWEFACYENREIAEAAFKGLAAFSLDQMKLSHLPTDFRSLRPSDDEKLGSTPEEELTYLPGSVWIRVLETIHVPSRRFAANLIIKLISDELHNYRTGIYMWPMGEPINFKYLPERSPARHVGEYLRRYTSSSEEDRDVAVECMRIFSQKYLKALPPIQWHLLKNAVDISEETQAYSVSLACHQAVVSPSARDYLSEYLAQLTSSCMTQAGFKKCWHVCTHLEDVARGLPSNALAPFLEASVNHVFERALVDNAVSMFTELMEKCASALRDDLVHHDNKTLIANVLEKLMNKADVDHKIFPSIVAAMLELPAEQVERLSLPSVWDSVTEEKLEKAIEVRGGLVGKRNNEIPLSWMNEILRVAANMPSVHNRLLKTMRVIQSRLRHEKSNATWTWDLMCRIQATIVDTNDNNKSREAEFLCDVLFVTIIVLASSEFLVNENLIATSHEARADLFPHAVFNIIQLPHWRDIIPQIMEWLHLIRTSSLPSTYKCIFHNALISLKKERQLNEHWIKYLSIKGPMILQ